ncbi:hypothetical protein H0H81_005723 [Sphagnurus paluster]|uniref:N-alpha-acetyltransferase 60 n=1 Tax=Sphagnurus paluster TaxID=117069 RepID=A0A9P7KJN9_9AGAR|nr:hypothetical protein H0H81_005723 [Sphagnurus paluster]
MRSVDIPNVRALHDALLPMKYPTAFFIQLTLLRERVCLVAYHPESPASPIAFISASLQQDPCVHGLLKSYTLAEDFSDPKVSEDLPHIEILTLGVFPAYQQCGIARLLVRRVYDYFRENLNQTSDMREYTVVHTNVATSNTPALSFYERMGLRITSGVVRNLYRACPQGSKDGYLLVGRISS